MAKFKVRVGDTITFKRTCVTEIEAASEVEALHKVLDQAIDGAFHEWKEEEIDNTPYETEIVK